ncbi:ABC transporter E family member 2 [Orchesella cincta]|uniref:ABC transporter E family member 2 n=1 Tax=Orchesella cincta TaxID=48709 RepID=A0A1D2MES2_ORCCI|nr:ABC transporter E family member 2 [Orchesella cincta]
MARYEYPTMTKTMGSFRLDVTVGPVQPAF